MPSDPELQRFAVQRSSRHGHGDGSRLELVPELRWQVLQQIAQGHSPKPHPGQRRRVHPSPPSARQPQHANFLLRQARSMAKGAALKTQSADSDAPFPEKSNPIYWTRTTSPHSHKTTTIPHECPASELQPRSFHLNCCTSNVNPHLRSAQDDRCGETKKGSPRAALLRLLREKFRLLTRPERSLPASLWVPSLR